MAVMRRVREPAPAAPEPSTRPAEPVTAGYPGGWDWSRYVRLDPAPQVGASTAPEESEAERAAEAMLEDRPAAITPSAGEAVRRRPCAACSGGGCSACASADEDEIRRSTDATDDGGTVSPEVAAELRELGPGHALPAETRGRFEPLLGIPLDDVRVHDDARAARLATELDAEAFTLGDDIVLGAPLSGTDDDARLIAHELAHVAQQDPRTIRRRDRTPSDDGRSGDTAHGSGSNHTPAEQEAEEVGRLLARHDPVPAGAVRPVREIPSQGTGTPSTSLQTALDSRQGGGSPLPSGLRERFEAGLGTGLGDVRVHGGPEAAVLAESVGAEAFTYGSDIYLGRGAAGPGTLSGRELLAHEVVHTVQQRGGAPAVQLDPEDDLRPVDVAVTRAHQFIERLGEAAPRSERPGRRRGAGPAGRTPQPGSPRTAAVPATDPFAPVLQAMPGIGRDLATFGADVYEWQRRLWSYLHPPGTYRVPQPQEAYFRYRNVLEREVAALQQLLSAPSDGSARSWVSSVQNALFEARPLIQAVALRPFAFLPADMMVTSLDMLQTRGRELTNRLDDARRAERATTDAASTTDPDRLARAIEYLQRYAQRPGRDRWTFQSMYGLEVAHHLVRVLGLSNAEVRVALRRLRDVDSEAFQRVLLGGALVATLLREFQYSGFLEFRSEEEGFAAGYERGRLENLRGDAPVEQEFDAADRAIAAGAFVLGAFQGVGDAIIDATWGTGVGIWTISTDSEAREHLLNALRDLPGRVVDALSTAEGRYTIGVALGTAIAEEERAVLETGPFEFGRRLGQVFGRIVAEVVLLLIPATWALRAIRGVRLSGRLGETLAALARTVARSRAVQLGLAATRWTTGAAQGLLRAIHRRLVLLVRRLPRWAQIFPNLQLQAELLASTGEVGIFRQAMANVHVGALQDSERALVHAGERVADAEEAFIAAVRAGDDDAARGAAARLDEAVVDLERAADRVEADAGRLRRDAAGAADEPLEDRRVGAAAETGGGLDAERAWVAENLDDAVRSADGRFVYELDHPDGHVWGYRRTGAWCRFSEPQIAGLAPGSAWARSLHLLLAELGVMIPGDAPIAEYARLMRILRERIHPRLSAAPPVAETVGGRNVVAGRLSGVVQSGERVHHVVVDPSSAFQSGQVPRASGIRVTDPVEMAGHLELTQGQAYRAWLHAHSEQAFYQWIRQNPHLLMDAINSLHLDDPVVRLLVIDMASTRYACPLCRQASATAAEEIPILIRWAVEESGAAIRC